MKVASLFAGIGGFDLGFQRFGFEIVAHVEKDASCRKLLATKFPDAITLDDVCTAGSHNLPKCDVLSAGFPCQDVSVAGLRAGLAGNRTGLFYQFTRIANELQPAFIVWENVPGLLSSNKGHDFLAILAEFRRIGYCGGWRTLDAQYFGLAQRRRRIFGVFARRDIGATSCAEILSLHEGMRGHPAPSRKARQEIAGTLGGSSNSGGFRTTDLDNNGAFIVGALDTNDRGATADKAAAGHYVVGALCNNGKATGGATQQDAESGLLIHAIADCLQERDSKGADSNTKNGHLIVARSSGRGYWTEDDKAATLGTEARAVHESTLIAHTLRGEGFDATAQHAVAFDLRGREGGAQFEGSHDTANIRAASGGSSRSYVAQSAVRRLTPRECERLQGFPDDWTAGFSDSTRYRMLGNAVAVPVIRWLAERTKSVMESL